MVNLTELFKHVTPERHWQSVLVNAEALTAEVLPAASAAAGRHIEQGVVRVEAASEEAEKAEKRKARKEKKKAGGGGGGSSERDTKAKVDRDYQR